VLIFYANAVYLLRARKVRTILDARANKTRSERRAQFWRGKRSTRLRCPSDQMEETMITRLGAITLTILIAALSLTGRAEAGASASAPTKNSRSSQVAAQQTGHHGAKNDVGITEYSSSSRRSH
jgi:hypothetical protein